MTMKGLLLTVTEPPAQMEEEFNAWYDSEHSPLLATYVAYEPLAPLAGRG